MSDVAAYLRELAQDPAEADVVIVAGDQEIRAHSLLLRRSSYFRSALTSNFQEGQTRKIIIPDVEPDHLRPLVESLYTDAKPHGAEPEDLLEMLSLCRRFIFPEVIATRILRSFSKKVEWGRNTSLMVAEAYRLDLPRAVEQCVKKVRYDPEKAYREFQALRGDKPKADSICLAKARMAVAETLMGLVQDRQVPFLGVQRQHYEVIERNPWSGHEVRVQRDFCSLADTQNVIKTFETELATQKDFCGLLFTEMLSAMRLLCSMTEAARPESDTER
mmetsp:Transcript_65246/g.142089  ORF Transcript_65246/g.142089 Transcript_65246/m.142089 type:complete len:275 (+) Transcript_65246:78-902(+)